MGEILIEFIKECCLTFTVNLPIHTKLKLCYLLLFQDLHVYLPIDINFSRLF